MKYGVIGSRKRTDKENVFRFVKNLSGADEIISGACRGVDSWAAEAARINNLKITEFPPDLTACKTKLDFTRAYYSRNRKIAENCDVLIAFVSSQRKGGTENTIREAKKLGKQVFIIPPGSHKPM